MKTLFVFCGVFIFVNDLISALREEDFPMPGACGTQIKERIIGGELTSIVDYPWFAMINYAPLGASRDQFRCGGSLIHKRYVITAAHCVKFKPQNPTTQPPNPYSVRLGEHNVDRLIDCEGNECADPPENIPIIDKIPHENYVTSSKDNDIALLRLARDAPSTDFIKPICLPFAAKLRNKNLDNIGMIVTGFGRTKNRKPSPFKLKLEIDGFNHKTCQSKYPNQVTSRQLCAGGLKLQDSCNGDSGSPLMGEELHSNWNTPPYTYLAGIVSFGPRICGQEGFPGVYTRVDQYLDWIKDHTEN